MQYTIPRHIMIRTICKNYLMAGVIKIDEVDHLSHLLEQYPDRDLVEVLLVAHMLNPLNLEEHQVTFVSVN